MRNARQILDEQYLTMRERILSLAADFDRIERSPGGSELLRGSRADPRLQDLQSCLRLILQSDGPHRAEAVQRFLSDKTKEPK